MLRHALNRTVRLSSGEGVLGVCYPSSWGKLRTVHQDGSACACSTCCRSISSSVQLEALGTEPSSLGSRHQRTCPCGACNPPTITFSASRDWPSGVRHYASAADKASTSSSDGPAKETASGQPKEGEPTSDGKADSEQGEEAAQPTFEQVSADFQKSKEQLTQMSAQVDKLTDQLKRALAEMENVRIRTARDVDNAKKFAVQGFVKSILDVSDNLERAASSVPVGALVEEGQEGALDAPQLRKLLKGLLEGVSATEKILLHVFKQNSVEMFNPLGEKFDPNMHNAMFEVPDATKEVGTVAAVAKRGFKLHGRVIRPADVGVVRAP